MRKFEGACVIQKIKQFLAVSFEVYDWATTDKNADLNLGAWIEKFDLLYFQDFCQSTTSLPWHIQNYHPPC